MAVPGTTLTNPVQLGTYGEWPLTENSSFLLRASEGHPRHSVSQTMRRNYGILKFTALTLPVAYAAYQSWRKDQQQISVYWAGGLGILAFAAVAAAEHLGSSNPGYEDVQITLR